MNMNCEICNKEAMENKVICSDHCAEIRLKTLGLIDKYFPRNGCGNCWGDLHQGCSDECTTEFNEARKFGKDLWPLVYLIINRERNKV